MAKEIPVKCLYCGQEFYRSQTEWVKPRGNRYAHKECAMKEEVKQGVILQVHDKMKNILGVNYNKTKIDKQIKSLLKEGKTEIGILRTLEYWYDIKQSSAAQANGGIGIVPYVYGEAMNYFDRQKRYKEMQQTIDIDSFIDDTKVLRVSPKPIRKPVGVKLFDLE